MSGRYGTICSIVGESDLSSGIRGLVHRQRIVVREEGMRVWMVVRVWCDCKASGTRGPVTPVFR